MGRFSNLWNRDKDGAYENQRSFLRFAVIAVSVCVCFVVFLTKDNVIRWIQAGFETRSQQKQIEMLRSLVGSEMCIRDRDTLEKYAREHFGFAAPGDDVYIME